MRLVYRDALALLTLGAAKAQEGTAYVVSYIEVSPAAATESAALLRQLRDASRKDPGAERFEVAQRIGYPNHFTVWKFGGGQNR